MSTLTADRPDSVEQQWIAAQPDPLREHVTAWRNAHKRGNDEAAEKALRALDAALKTRGTN